MEGNPKETGGVEGTANGPDAMAIYRGRYEQYPDNVAFNLNMAACHIRRKEYEEAIALLKIHLEANPWDINRLITLAKAYGLNHAYDKAIEAYTRALNAAPGETCIYIMRALEYVKNHNHEKAIADYGNYLKVFPTDVDVLLERSGSYRVLGNYDAAIADLKRMVELNPNDDRARTLIEAYADSKRRRPSPADRRLGHTASGQRRLGSREDSALKVKDMKLEDVIGLDHVKKELLMDVIYPLKHPDITKAYGLDAGGGIILYGPPGCGKTMIARALAGSAGIGVVEAKISEVLDQWVGNSEKGIRDVFERARKNAPCILYFDEIDFLGGSREASPHDSKVYNGVVDSLLAELDGLSKKNAGILVMGATNMPWSVDVALRRPGRLGKMLYVSPPNAKCRAELFKKYMAGRMVDGTLDYEALARATERYAAADIAGACIEANKAAYCIAVETGRAKGIDMGMLMDTVSGRRPSLGEWFSSARLAVSESGGEGAYPELMEDIKRYEGSLGGQQGGQYR